MKSRELNECRICKKSQRLHWGCPTGLHCIKMDGSPAMNTYFTPVVVWELTEAERKTLDYCINCGKSEKKHYALFDFDAEGKRNTTNPHYFCKADGVTPSFVPVVVWELSETEVKLLKEAKK